MTKKTITLHTSFLQVPKNSLTLKISSQAEIQSEGGVEESCDCYWGCAANSNTSKKLVTRTACLVHGGGCNCSGPGGCMVCGHACLVKPRDACLDFGDALPGHPRGCIQGAQGQSGIPACTEADSSCTSTEFLTHDFWGRLPWPNHIHLRAVKRKSETYDWSSHVLGSKTDAAEREPVAECYILGNGCYVIGCNVHITFKKL